MARLGPERFHLVTGTGFRTHDGAWIDDHLPDRLRLRDATGERGTLSPMGPRAQDILGRLTDHDLSNAAFPSGHAREPTVAGRPIPALRVTYVGEPVEAGLARATKLRLGQPFRGRDAVGRRASEGVAKRLAAFRLADAGAVLVGRETILRDGALAGYCTSGGYGGTLGAALRLGYVRDPGGITDAALLASAYAVVVAGREVPAEASLTPFLDPKGARVRA